MYETYINKMKNSHPPNRQMGWEVCDDIIAH
jgi:uncharacterized short protein YbdD (DUF466 family)